MGEMVEFPGNGVSVPGYVARPTQPSPGVVVIQEWWGLVPHIKDVADRLAAQGFVALAPDLFRGASTTEPDEAGKLMMAMNMPQTARDLTGAVDWLLQDEGTTGDGVGSIGFCMGGGLSLYLATLRPEVKACVSYYGVIPWPEVTPDYAAIQGRILGHYADHDDFASVATVEALEQDLRSLGKDVEFHIHPDTHHAFFNDTRPDVYNPAEARQSWERTIAFFKESLGG